MKSIPIFLAVACIVMLLLFGCTNPKTTAKNTSWLERFEIKQHKADSQETVIKRNHAFINAYYNVMGKISQRGLRNISPGSDIYYWHFQSDTLDSEPVMLLQVNDLRVFYKYDDEGAIIDSVVTRVPREPTVRVYKSETSTVTITQN